MKPAACRRVYARLYAAYGPQHWWPGESPFEIMVGAVLTQNTAWSNVEKAIANLKQAQVLSPPSDCQRTPAASGGMAETLGLF